MAKLSYKQRIHKNKISLRSLRYVIADQAARLLPGLRERWLFPAQAVPMADRAIRAECYDAIAIESRPPPAVARLVKQAVPLRSLHKVYEFEGASVIGQSGALVQNGVLLAVRPNPNWAVSLRPCNYRRLRLEEGTLHYALLPPAPAIGHVFHWLFDYVSPFMAWLERRRNREPVRPIVNARRTEFQSRTIAYLVERYGLAEPVAIGAEEAAFAPRVALSVLEPFAPRAMQNPAGLAALAPLGEFLSEGKADPAARRRIYVSRNDAKLRRVANEGALQPLLRRFGFETVTLTGMPIAEQVRLFIEAEAVAAPHGAGLAHLAWMRAGGKAIEFLPSPHGPRGAPRNATANFWIVSQQKGLDYRAYEAGPPLNRDDAFEIPETLLAEALASAFDG